MSFVAGEVDLSPPTIGQSRIGTAPGTRYVLLDSVRDSAFLNVSKTDALGNTISDMGLGCVDNGLFTYTTRFTPGSPTVARPYPYKYYWLGSPSGTNDTNDVFSIFVADVNQSAFYPGAPASAWLLNPRLVLSLPQAKNDIVAWFDANYPGGGTGGVGNTGTGSNSTYGTLTGDNSNPGNVSVMNSIDGQFWPIYDRVDDSILLYFSFKTPNANTLAIYCYKITNTEISSPASSSEFLGGLNSPTFPSYQIAGSSNIYSSHRFVIASDSLGVFPRASANDLQAVLITSGGARDTATADHGGQITSMLIEDIHADPIAPTTINLSASSGYQALDQGGEYPVDKFGSISVAQPLDNALPGYAFLYNAPSDRDVRSGSNKVVINSMQVRVAYWAPYAINMATGQDPILTGDQLEVSGCCRPQFTFLPDGLPKIIYNNWTPDNNLRTEYIYVDPDIISPRNQSRIRYQFNSLNGTSNYGTMNTHYSFGKRAARLVSFLNENAYTSKTDPSVFPSSIELAWAGRVDNTQNGLGMFDSPWYMSFVSRRRYHLSPGSGYIVQGIGGSQSLLEIDLEIPLPWFQINLLPKVNRPIQYYLELHDPPIASLPDHKFGYLTNSLKAITPNNTASGEQTGPLTTNTKSEFVETDDCHELVVNFTISTVLGTNPTLTIKLNTFDPMEGTAQSTLTLNATAITTSSHIIKLIIANGNATLWMDGNANPLGGFSVPSLWGVEFDIGGTSSSYSITATFEARRK